MENHKPLERVSLLHDWAKSVWHYIRYPGRQPAPGIQAEPPDDPGDIPLTGEQEIDILNYRIDDLKAELRDLRRKFEDYIALKRGVPGHISLQEMTGYARPPEGIVHHGVYLNDPVICWIAAGQWYIIASPNREVTKLTYDDCEHLTWYKKIS